MPPAKRSGTKRLLRYLFERSERVAFAVGMRFSRHPSLKLHADYLRFKHEGDLPAIARHYGVDLATLREQQEAGIDNPAYRFHRDGGFFAWFVAHAAEFDGCSWLDVGADTGAVSLYLSQILHSTSFELCDVTVPARANFPVRRIDGGALPYEARSFDLVFFSYVLHHAADDTIALLRDAHRIARRFVIVSEDPKETDDDYYWAWKHDKRGTFRGCKEWRQLFTATGFTVVHEEDLDHDLHSRHFFVLAPDRSSGSAERSAARA